MCVLPNILNLDEKLVAVKDRGSVFNLLVGENVVHSRHGAQATKVVSGVLRGGFLDVTTGRQLELSRRRGCGRLLERDFAGRERSNDEADGFTPLNVTIKRATVQSVDLSVRAILKDGIDVLEHFAEHNVSVSNRERTGQVTDRLKRVDPIGQLREVLRRSLKLLTEGYVEVLVLYLAGLSAGKINRR